MQSGALNYNSVVSDSPADASSFLAVNSSGKVIKSAATASPAGSDGELQFNQNGETSANSQYTVDGSGSMTIGTGGGTLYVRNKLDVPQITSSFNPGANGQGWQLGYGDGSEGGQDQGGALSIFASSSAQGVDGYMSFFTANSSSYTDGGGSNNYKRVQINNALRVQNDIQLNSVNNHTSASLNTVNWKLKVNEGRSLAFFTGSAGESSDYLAFSASATDPAVRIGVALNLQGVEAGTIKNANSYLALNSNNQVISTSSAGGGGGSVAGSDTQVQFNQNGNFGANSNFTYNGSGSLTLGNTLIMSGASNIQVNSFSNYGALNQEWTLNDGVDGLTGNGALLFFTGSEGDFMKFHTSGSSQKVLSSHGLFT